jgi:hypothetical protein
MKCVDDENFGKENFSKENFGKVLNFAEVENTSEVENTPEAKNASKAESKKTNFSPLHLLDYIYAVLHSPKYRETYKEFLKIDFPRVPFPDAVGTSRDLSTIQKNFWDLVQLGSEIRKLHLLEEISNKDLQTKYPIAGNNVVAKPTFVTTENFSAKRTSAKFQTLPKLRTLQKLKTSQVKSSSTKPSISTTYQKPHGISTLVAINLPKNG